MHLLYIDAVDGRLRFAEDLEYAFGIGLDGGRQVGGVDHFKDAAEVTVFGRGMFGRIGDDDAKLGGGDTTALDAFERDGCTDGERLERAGYGFAIRSRIGKRANQHVPRDAGERIDITNGHGYSSV